MNTLKALKTLHHAYLIEAIHDDIRDELISTIEKDLQVSTKGNPDFQVWEHVSFGIDESRKLQESASVKVGDGRQIFVISFSSITREAQNALLKLFEEPTPNTHFFLISPSAVTLLPTLRSRLHIISTKQKRGIGSNYIKNFLKASGADRITIINEIIATKDRAKALQFLGDIEVYLHQELKGDERYSALKEIMAVRKFLHDRSSSIKMVLEHIALTAPSI